MYFLKEFCKDASVELEVGREKCYLGLIMVDREHNLGQDESAVEFEIPQQRQQKPREVAPPQIGLSDQELRTFFPAGNYEFERTQLEVSGIGIEEIGIHQTGERIEAYQLGPDGKRKALRGVLTGYQGTFGRGEERDRITIDLVGILVGDEMGTEIYTEIPGLDIRKYAQRVADKNIPISIGTNKRTGASVLSSRTPAGLLADLSNLEGQLGIFSSHDRLILHHARGVAQYVRTNFKTERPPDQPGRAKVKGQ